MSSSRFTTCWQLLWPTTSAPLLSFYRRTICLSRHMCHFRVLNHNVKIAHLHKVPLHKGIVHKQCRISSPLRKVTRNLKSDINNVSLDTRLNSVHHDQLLNLLANVSSVDDVFVAVNSNDVWLPSHISAVFGTLDKLIFKQLATYPWAIYNNPVMLYIQSFTNSESKEIFQPILQCPEFDQLCSEAQKLRSRFCNRDLVNVTLCLLKLHVNIHNDVFREFFLECLERHKEFDLEDLLTFSNVANYMKRSGFHVSALISQVLCKQWNTLDESAQTMANISKLLSNVGYFMPKETLWNCQDKLLEMLYAHQDATHPSTVVELIEVLKRFVGDVKPNLIEIAISIFEKNIDPTMLWYISRSAFYLREVKGPLRDKIRALTVEHLNDLNIESLRTSEFISLLNLHNTLNYPNNSERTLEHFLEGHICNLDVILLKYLSYTKVMWNTKNKNLIAAYCNRVHQKLDDLLGSLSCLLIVTECLAKISNRPDEFDKTYAPHLMHQVLDQQLGTQPQHIAHVGRYLAQCYKNLDRRLISLLSGKILCTMPYFSLNDITHISLGIVDFDSSSTRAYKDQLITNFAREILLRKKEIENIDELNLLVKSVFSKLNGIFRDAVIQDLAELYAFHAKTVTVTSIYRLASQLGDLRLLIPEVCEQLANIIISNPSLVNFTTLTQTLKMFSTCNYHPDNLIALQEIATAKALKCLNESEVGNNLVNTVITALSLSVLGRFPETLLRKIFSLSFLTNLDTTIRNTSIKKNSSYLQALLAELNRSVVLQCPHLGIPWLGDDYLLDYHRSEYSHIVKWKNILYDGLVAALEGEEFVKCGPLYTPYNHMYDFECLLDENQRLLPINSQTWHTRVAVMLMTPSNYCANNRSLLGHVENKLLQLEILGFKVVLIPYFHLDSMMLSDSESIQKYCINKIFTTNSSSTL